MTVSETSMMAGHWSKSQHNYHVSKYQGTFALEENAEFNEKQQQYKFTLL